MKILFFFFAILRGLQDLSSLTRDRTQAMAVKAPSPNYWTVREFPENALNQNFLIAHKLWLSPHPERLPLFKEQTKKCVFLSFGLIV